MAATKYTVSFSGTTIETTVTNKAVEVEQWLHLHHLTTGGQSIIVGLDCEWKPNTYNNKTATLSLCVDTKCLIIQLLHLDYIPQSLKNLFNSYSNLTFVGVEVDNDIAKLGREYGLYCNTRAVDIGNMARARFPNLFSDKPGLKMLAEKVVGLSVDKPVDVIPSDWEARNLSLEQIRYASVDAYASWRIGNKLLNQL